MRQKTQAHQYLNVEQFSADFELMIDNCLTYNAKETIFYRAALKLRDQVSASWQKFRVLQNGFNYNVVHTIPLLFKSVCY